MTANFAALGILASIRADPRPAGSLEPFRIPMLCLGSALGVGALGLVVALLKVQVAHGHEHVVRPHLSLQADGAGRYQYNPRVLDIVRALPRGTVYDRKGLPLATENSEVALRSREAYHKLGVSLDATCENFVSPGARPDRQLGTRAERCYPLGGRAFHLLGDSRTRVNWSATNTSYVERDAEDRLRGFNDHATSVQTVDAAGRPAWAIRRDYRELGPLVRHRYEPDHPAFTALLNRSRDVHLTVDARLQLHVASIVSDHAKRSAGGKASAVVLDPDTGELLAIASYPWPVLASSEDRQTNGASDGPDALLDRARYGLYPPGSTFKLVTAAAALGRDIALSCTTFTCTRLPEGRVGARIAGWGRPIRDDVLDRHPHGTIDMHDGLVESCNAYFAQLAVRLGPEALRDAARRLGISLTPSNSIQRIRATLPQAGYGQGEVVATPLRMARVAAALAAEGVVRETRWEIAPSQPVKKEVWLSRDAARLLASYLRDAVVKGTARSLRNHPWRIAGKTGTAEVAGSPSHAWFVGFAPYGPATKRIAFAVIIENAGYGSFAAVPVAGEIVTAAASAGLIR